MGGLRRTGPDDSGDHPHRAHRRPGDGGGRSGHPEPGLWQDHRHLRLPVEPVNGYKQVSKELREVLLIVAAKLTGLTKKEQEIIYKKLKRGKKRCR